MFVEADAEDRQLSSIADTARAVGRYKRPYSGTERAQRPLRMLNQLEARVAAARNAVDGEVLRLIRSEAPGLRELCDAALDRTTRSDDLGPASCLAACGLLGVDKRKAVRSATALEVYRCSLESNTVASQLSVTLGALLDDASQLSPEVATHILAVHAEMAREVAAGHATREQWLRDDTWDIDQLAYVKVVCQTQAWGTFVAPILCGATIANPKSPRIRWLRRFAILLGVASHIANEAHTASVAPGQRTLPLLHAVHAAEPGLRQELIAALAPLDRVATTDRQGVPTRQPDVEGSHIRDALAVAGSLAYTRVFARHLAEQARDALQAACKGLPISSERAYFEELTERTLAACEHSANG